MPPMMGADAPASALDANARGGSGGGPPDPQAQIAAARQAADPFKQFLASMPSLQPLQKKFDQLFKEAIVEVAKQAPQQTQSSQGLPG